MEYSRRFYWSSHFLKAGAFSRLINFHFQGPAVAPKELVFVESVPKTRSGKILRRLLKARGLGMPEGDLSTMEQP